MFSHLLEEKENNIFEKSCVPASIAIVFASLLIKNQKTHDSYSKVKHILELAIYPQLWETRGGFSKAKKAYSFFKSFLKSANITKIKNKEDVEKLVPHEDYVLFSITPTHVCLIFSANNKFINSDDFTQSDSLRASDSSSYFEKVDLVNLDLDKISAYYEQYKKEISSILRKKYFNNSNVQKWLRMRVNILHEVAPDLLQEKLKDLIMWYTWDNIKKICALLPEKKSIVKEIIFSDLNHFTKFINDLENILALFPEEKDIITRHILKNPLSFSFRSEYDYISEHLKDTKNELDLLILNIILNNPSSILPTHVRELIKRYSGQQRLAIEVVILKDLNIIFKNSWDIDDLSFMVEFFPDKKDQIQHYVTQNLKSFIKAEKYVSRDYKIRELGKLFPEIKLPSATIKKIGMFNKQNNEIKDQGTSVRTDKKHFT